MNIYTTFRFSKQTFIEFNNKDVKEIHKGKAFASTF